jgi:hypothetical protein
MITEIEMLKKRVKFLETKLLQCIERIDYAESNPFLRELFYECQNMFSIYDDEYGYNVAKIGCRECLKENNEL